MSNILSQKERCFIYVSAIFFTSIIISNILATKLWMIGGIIIPAGVIAYPLTFLMTDVIGEVWGKKRVYTVVWAGFWCAVFSMLLGFLAVQLPAAPFYADQAFFARLFGSVGRITIAGLCAYMVSQTFDVWMFHVIRDRTGKKHLWLRNNVATMLSQVFDTTIFILIAFYGVMPTSALISMMFGQYIIKFIFALCDTPFCYLLIAYCNRQSDCVDVVSGRLIADVTKIEARNTVPERAPY